jgi:GT2 family glycosyltransferase
MEVRVLRFRRQMHYSHGLTHALSLTPPGDDLLFVSHDMLLTPGCAAALNEQVKSDSTIGIVRPVSEHMDWAKTFVTLPPRPIENLLDASAFAAQVRRERGNEAVEWPMLIGDAMLIRAEVIARIGVFDPRYYGFMGDIDYGVRAARAGFRHVIARGAWLHHDGAGTAKTTGDALAQGEGLQRLVESAYAEFRAKWGESNLPPHFRDMRREHFLALHAMPPSDADAYIAPLPWSDEIGEMI